MKWTWRRYLTQTLAVAGTIGIVVASLRCTFEFKKFDWTEFPWSIGCFIVAFILVDWVRGQKVFER